LKALLLFCNDRGRKTEAEIEQEDPAAAIDPEDFNKLSRRFGADFECRGLRVLDVGCGVGELAISMAQAGAHVTGIDVDASRIRRATALARGVELEGSVRFVHGNFLEFEADTKFDRVLSLEAFEHIPDPDRFLPKMAELLGDGGKILSVFGPLWLSPYGPHQYGFTRFPWVHLFFPERVVIAARRITYRPTDPATRYEDIRGGLNRLTVAKFRRFAAEAGLRFERFSTNPQLRGPVLRAINGAVARIPFLDEFFTHTILCVLVPSGQRDNRGG
jgi:SAM-dependent methyltransferase